MKIVNFFKNTIKYLLKLFLISTIIMSVVLLIAFIYGKPISSFSTILSWTSGIIFIIGGLSIIGSFTSTMNFNYQYCRTVNNKHASDNVSSDLNDRNRSFKFLVAMSIIALIIFGYGSLLALLT